MSDPTEGIRRQMVGQMDVALEAAIDRGETPMTTEAMRRAYEVVGFLAPFVMVNRKSDGARGTLMFTHNPRWYFGWEAEDE